MRDLIGDVLLVLLMGVGCLNMCIGTNVLPREADHAEKVLTEAEDCTHTRACLYGHGKLATALTGTSP